MSRIVFKQVLVAVVALLTGTLSCFAGSRPPALDLSAIRALRVDIVDSSNCGGSAGTQAITKSAPLRGGNPGCKYRLRITVEGRVETQDAPFDYVYLNGEMLFGGNDDNGECAMTTKIETREIELASGDNVTLTYDTADPYYHVGAYAKVTRVVEVKSCGSSSCTIGGGSVDLGSVDVVLSMGAASYDSSAGEIWISEARPSPDLATPKVLQYECDLDDVEVITNAFLRQVKTPQGLADIVTNNAFSYEVRFFYVSIIGAKSNGIYQLSGQPFSLWRFENPDASTNTYNRFWVSEIKGSTTNAYKFTWDEGSSTWELNEGSGSEESTVAQEASTQVVGGYTNKVYVREVRSASEVVIFKEKETATCYPWGEEFTENIADPDGAAVTNRWLFYTTTDVPTNSTSYGRMKAIVNASGYWETYEYDSAGYLSKTRAQFLNAAFGVTDDLCRVTTVTNYHGNGYDEVKTIEKLLGQEVARTYKVSWWNPNNDSGRLMTNDEFRITYPGQDWSSQYILRTRTVIDVDGNPHRIERPDGTMSFYAYSTTSTSKTTMVSDGAPDAGGAAITNGARTVTTVDQAGNLISEYRYAIPQTNVLLHSAVVTEKDDLGRPTRIEYNDGTYETKSYSCCGLESWRDREGIYTTYNYNDQKLVSSESRAGVTMLYTYDAKGHRTKIERQAGGGSAVTIGTAAYDLAGRQTNATDSLGYSTAYTETKDASGNPVKSSRNPDNSLRVETYYQDGNLLSVTGTAVHPLQYAYGVESSTAFVTEVKIGDAGGTGEWARTWTDFASRKSRVQYADGTEESFQFNAKGQLEKQTDRDGGAKLFLYNGNGEVEYSVVDLNTNGAVEFSGSDRITRMVREVASAHGTYVQRVSTYVWPSNSVDTSALALMQETSLTGLENWLTAYGLTTHETTTLDDNGGKTVTSIAPDGSFTVSTYSTGRLVSVTRYTSSSQQVFGVTYGYDGYGRQVTLTDARSGTTSNAFDSADRLTSTTTPPATNGASPQTTSYSYDNMGRVTAITLPDGGVVSNQYFDTGELKQTSGARTYPVAYTYDAQGRVKTLTTWKNFAGGSGQAVTTWDYDPQSGYMTGKVYADNSTNGYTCTGSGKVKTRTWARGIVTTYSYNSAGDLLTVVYSDGTAGVTNTFDRLGRVASVSDACGTRSSTYTQDGQALAESYSSGVLSGCAVNRQYDAYSRLFTLSAVASTTSTVQYGYDAASRMHTVQSAGSTVTYSYYPNSSLVSNMVFNNGSSNVLTTTKEYDNLNRLSLIRHVPGADATVSFAYSYNNANQRTRCEMADGSYWLYTYDSLGQLLSAVKYWSNAVEVAGQSFKYAYDDIGNRTATTNNGRAASYTANSLNQYTQRIVPGYADIIGAAHSQAVVTVNNQPVTRQEGGYFHKGLVVSNAASAAYPGISVVGVRPNAGSNGNDIVTTETGAVFVAQTPEAFTYDADGNLLTDSRWTNTWDGEGRLVRMETLAGLSSNVPRQRIEFVYDSVGRRISKCLFHDFQNGAYLSTNRASCLYDGEKPIADTKAGALTNTFVWGLALGGNAVDAGGVGGILILRSGTNRFFYGSDVMGSIVLLMNHRSAGLVAQYDYAPGGKMVRSSNGFLNPLAYCTQRMDEETERICWGDRWYSTDLDRYLSRLRMVNVAVSHPYTARLGLPLYGFAAENGPAGETSCRYFQQGELMPIVNNNNTCARSCTQEHEEQHVRDISPCCARARAAYFPLGWQLLPDIILAPIRNRVHDKWLSYRNQYQPVVECRGYSRSVSCATRLMRQKGCCPYPSLVPPNESTCCSELRTYWIHTNERRKEWCAKSSGQMPSCPF